MAMARDGRIDGLSQASASEVNGFQCSYWIMGKGKRLPSPRSNIRATAPLAVDDELWGPAYVVSSGGAKYFLTCYVDFTRKVNLTFLKAKSEAFVAMQQYVAKVERQLSCKVKTIRSDNSGELTSKQWEQHMLQHGIQHTCMPPHAHAQNGRVEWVLTVLDDVRTLLLHSGLPSMYWAEAANYSAYIRNHALSDNKQTPLDLWTGSQTTVDHLYAFGCKLYFREYRQTSNLQPRYKERRLLGYVDCSHTCRVIDTLTKRVIAKRDVVFAENGDFAIATSHNLDKVKSKTHSKYNFHQFQMTMLISNHLMFRMPVKEMRQYANSLRKRTTVQWYHLVQVPWWLGRVSFERAVSCPTIPETSYYSLVHLIRLLLSQLWSFRSYCESSLVDQFPFVLCGRVKGGNHWA
jgi:hypothetical protein